MAEVEPCIALCCQAGWLRGGGSYGSNTSARYHTHLKEEASKGTAFINELLFFFPLDRLLGAMQCITMWSLNATLEIFFPSLLTTFSVGFCCCSNSLVFVLEQQKVHQWRGRFTVPVVKHT